MGINLQGADWYEQVAKTREEDRKRVEAGKPSKLQGDRFDVGNNIHSTPAGEKFIADHVTKFDENDKAMVSTARGKRRKAKRQSSC